MVCSRMQVCLRGFQIPVANDLLDSGDVDAELGEGQGDKGVAEVVGASEIVDPSSPGTFEEPDSGNVFPNRGAFGRGEDQVTVLAVGLAEFLQDLCGFRGEGNLAFVGLGVPVGFALDFDYLAAEIDVLPMQMRQFADSKPRVGQKTPESGLTSPSGLFLRYFV